MAVDRRCPGACCGEVCSNQPVAGPSPDMVGLGRFHRAVALFQSRRARTRAWAWRPKRTARLAWTRRRSHRTVGMPSMQDSYYSRLPPPCDKSPAHKTARRTRWSWFAGAWIRCRGEGMSLLDVAADAEAYKACARPSRTHSLLVFRDQRSPTLSRSPTAAPSGRRAHQRVGLARRRRLLLRLTNLATRARSCRPDHRQVLVAKANALWHTDSSFKKTPALRIQVSAAFCRAGWRRPAMRAPAVF